MIAERILKRFHPVTQRRLRHFRESRLAYGSFWIFVATFALSLVAELYCNSSPLYLRCDGRSFFPVLVSYTQDEILHNGIHTRTDYKELRRSEAFRKDPSNVMLFPLIPYGPLEILDASSIEIPDTVQVRLLPNPRIATADVRPDLSVARTIDDGYFLGGAAAVTNEWTLPDIFTAAMRRRFKNREAGAESASLVSRSGRAATLSMSDYAARPQAPGTVRITFREETADTTGRLFRVGRDLKLPEGMPTQVLAAVAQRFHGEVAPVELVLDGARFRAIFSHEEVRFPMRPVPGHPCGLDYAGRDVLARIIYAWRTSISFGLALVLVSMVIGTAFGAWQGFYGGARDIVGQRLVEIWDALPFLYIMMLIGSVYGRGFLLLLIVYGLFNWIGISYYMRAEFLRLRKMPFVESARCLGLSNRKIIFRHILPNALVPIVTFFPFSLVGSISVLAALDYLGFGLPPPTPSWGEMLAEAQDFVWSWWLVLYPALALFLVILLCVFIGEGVRSAYDPRRFSKIE